VSDTPINFRLALNVRHSDSLKAADAFWQYWKDNGETHRHGYYESTWGAINRAIRMVGVMAHDYGPPPMKEEEMEELNDASIKNIVDAIAAAAWHYRDAETSRELRDKVAELAVPLLKRPEAAHGFLLVRKEHIHRLLMLIDPAPMDVEGKTYVFKNPMAAEVLTRLSAEVRAMVDSMQSPLPPPPKEQE
jgi:hypothetical protein